MGRAVEAILLLLALAVISGFAITYLRARWRRAHGHWEVRQHTAAGALVVCLEKPGEDPWYVGAVSAEDQDRGYLLAELRSQAEEMRVEANAK